MRYKLSGNLTFIHTLIPQYTGERWKILLIIDARLTIYKEFFINYKKQDNNHE